MNQITKFEGQEIKVKTDKGVTLINLVCTARVCGLTKTNGSGNKVVRWKGDRGISGKLKNLLDTNVSEQIKTELKYVLSEIENTDDRNTIYMSTWLSKRLALECHSQTAMRYKNFLVTLDEKVKKIDMNKNVAMVGQIVNQIIPTLTEQLAIQIVPVITEVKNNVNKMAGLMYDQSTIYDQDREEIKSMIGFRAINTKKLTTKMKDKLFELFGFMPKASHHIYKRAKNKVFNEFDVIKWEDIPVSKYNAVYAFIDGFEKDDFKY